MKEYSEKLYEYLNRELMPFFNLRKKTYSEFEEFKKGCGRSTDIKIKGISLNCYEDKISEIFKNFEEISKKFFYPKGMLLLHGSFATYDYTEFSDIDLLLILDVKKSDSVLIQKGIGKILKLTFSFDYTQHHGVFILDKRMFNCYPQWFLPLETFKNMKSFGGDFEISITPYEDVSFSKERFRTFIRGLQNTYESGIYIRNGYNFKHFVSRMLLIPSLFLQSKGINVYKRESFEIFSEMNIDRWGIFDFLSEVRNKWMRRNNPLPHFPTWYPWIYHKVNRFFSHGVYKHLPDEIILRIDKINLGDFFKLLEREVESL